MTCKNIEPIENTFQNIEEFIDYAYTVFTDDFNYLISNFTYDELPLSMRRQPITEEKIETFWHIICEDDGDEEIVNEDRLSRIKYPRQILTNCFTLRQDCTLAWIRRNKKIHIICDDMQYLVVLELRPKYVLFITGFPINYQGKLEKLLKEYDNTPKERILI